MITPAAEHERDGALPEGDDRALIRRFFFVSMLVPFAIGSSLALLSILAGISRAGSLRHLGFAGALVIFAAAALGVIARRDRGGFFGWVLFPVMWLAALGQLPFLALAVYPPLERTFSAEGRVEAAIVERPSGRRLELWFPHDVEPGESGDSNLRLGSVPLPRAYYESHRDRFRWLNPRLLSIDIESLGEDLELGEVTEVVVNGERTSRPFHYKSGDRVPIQTVRVERD